MNRSIQSAYMFFDKSTGQLTQHYHIDDTTLQTLPATNLPQNAIFTAGDDSEAKTVFIEEIQSVSGNTEFGVSYEAIQPKFKTFKTLADAQNFALALLQQPTRNQRNQLEEESLKQQKAYEQYARSTYSNPYLTGGRRSSKKRRYYSYRNS